MALGCTVLHDVPCGRFNIDHLVIGPRAVYAVETKSVRKPKDDYKVIYDGERLHFPGFSDSKRLEQARRQADWLAKHLRQLLNRPIPVVPALALPGWWIESKNANADVQVFTPTGRGANFMAGDRGGVGIDWATAGLVTQALVCAIRPATRPRNEPDPFLVQTLGDGRFSRRSHPTTANQSHF
jgi:hypothetical protein